MRNQRYATARARTDVKAPWYNESGRFTPQQIQNALLKKASPRDVLTASAKKA